MSDTYINKSSGKMFKSRNLEIPSFFKEYLSYLQTQQFSQATQVTYFVQLRKFFQWFLLYREGKDVTKDELAGVSLKSMTFRDVEDIQAEDVGVYLGFCESFGDSSSTRALKLTVIRQFFEYYRVIMRRLSINPAENVPEPKMADRLPIYPTVDETIQLLSSIKGSETERNYCIITFFVNCGFRLEELVSLNLDNIHPDGSIRLIGKGGHERVVYLNEACQAALSDYLAVRATIDGADKEPALFISKRRKQRLTRSAVQKLVEKAFKVAGLQGHGYSTHKLRHAAATNMHRAGVDIRVIQVALGHQNLSTTQIYTHVEDERIRSAMASTPLSNIVRDKPVPSLGEESGPEIPQSSSDADTVPQP